MKMPGEWLNEEVPYLLVDQGGRVFAPYLLNGAVFSLNAGRVPQLVLVRAEVEASSTRWVAAWVDDGAIGFARMTASVEAWSCYYEDANGVVDPDEAEVWSRPLSSVTGVEVHNPRCQMSRSGSRKEWFWTGDFRVQFADGHVMDLSPFSATDSDEQDQRLLQFVAALKASRLEQ